LLPHFRRPHIVRLCLHSQGSQGGHGKNCYRCEESVHGFSPFSLFAIPQIKGMLHGAASTEAVTPFLSNCSFLSSRQRGHKGLRPWTRLMTIMMTAITNKRCRKPPMV
jgi:hypothetical protein